MLNTEYMVIYHEKRRAFLLQAEKARLIRSVKRLGKSAEIKRDNNIKVVNSRKQKNHTLFKPRKTAKKKSA